LTDGGTKTIKILHRRKKNARKGKERERNRKDAMRAKLRVLGLEGMVLVEGKDEEPTKEGRGEGEEPAPK